MDFGLVGLDNLVCSSNTEAVLASNNVSEKGYGSGFFKQERAVNENEFREFKVAKTSPFGETMLKIPLLQRSHCSTEAHQQMLSCSSPNSQTVPLPYYHQTATALTRNTGYGYAAAGMNGGSMHGVRGPFTPSQWMELERQALIYRYIDSNVPIPSYLLNPIRKALESAGFPVFSALRSNALGWGGFHLGFSNTDPEPGRCRRTDGKKWRCSRDAVVDQKYCERHMNRGRHRSRKPVEPGNSAITTTTTTTNAKLMTTHAASVVAAGGGASNTLSPSHHHQLNNLLSASSNNSSLAGIPNINRNLLKKENADGYQHTTVLSMTSPKISVRDNNYSISKPQQNAYQESEFGLVCSDSLLNPLNTSSSLVSCRNYGTTSDNLNDHGNKSQHGLRQFMDDWPKTQSEQRSAISWPEINLQPDRTTQLSISIPMATSDYMSSTSSPTNEKITASPLRLSRELEATQMGLGVGTINGGQRQPQNGIGWVPISWENSMGGPLGEVLHTTSNGNGECKATKALNLIESWDNSTRLVSSPTGVLQRGAFGSLSNSSAGSSPRAKGSRTHEGSTLCNGLIAPGQLHPSLPAL